MFYLLGNPDFWAEVQLTVPGQPEPATVRWHFKHLGRREVRALENRAVNELLDDADIIDQVTIGWEGPLLPGGEPAPYTRDALADLCDRYPCAGQEVWRAYLAALNTSRVGN